MSGLYDRWYMSDLMPWGGQTPAPAAENPYSAAPLPEPEPALSPDPAAVEQIVRSYHHRLGRPPSLDELHAALGLETDQTVTDTTQGSENSGVPWFNPIGQANARTLESRTGPRSPQLFLLPPGGGMGVPPPAPSSDPTQVNEDNPYLDAALKTLKAGEGVLRMPLIVADSMINHGGWLTSPAFQAYIQSLQDMVRSHVKAYDYNKSDPDKSYQTYTKEREDLGPCRYSQKTDPNMPCYYAGMTGGEYEPKENVRLRGLANFPTDQYREPQLDCSTKSWVAARAREQQLIQHFRGLGLSDNLINSIADYFWRPYAMELAERDCGHIRLPPPIPR